MRKIDQHLRNPKFHTPNNPNAITLMHQCTPLCAPTLRSRFARPSSQLAVKQEKAKAAAIAAVANADMNFKNGATVLPSTTKVVARPGYAPVSTNSSGTLKKVGPPVVGNRIGMGGLQSPVQVGGAGFGVESSSKKSTSSRRRASSKKSSNKGGGGRWTKEEDQKLR